MFCFSCLDPALSSRQLNNRGFPLIFLKGRKNKDLHLDRPLSAWGESDGQSPLKHRCCTGIFHRSISNPAFIA
jgi:hypothetical protein